MNFDAAIFDLDGTVLDSMDVWEHIDVLFLSKRGIEVPADYASKMCSLRFEDAAEYTIKLFNLPESKEDIIREWNELAIHEYSNNVKLLPYVLEYMLALKKSGMKLAVATGLPESLYKPCLINNSILEMFDVLCSTDDVSRGKEYPDVFLLAAEKLGVSPQKCIVFDDVLPAVKSGKAAGMTVCGVYDKYSAHNRTEMEKNADFYILNFKNAPLPDAF